MKNKFKKEYYCDSVIKKLEDDARRHKNRCEYYQSEFCLKLLHKCCGSANCNFYKEKNIEVSRKKITDGSFKVKYLETGRIYNWTIGKNISKENPLVKKVLTQNVGTTFKIGFENMQLIEKNIK